MTALLRLERVSKAFGGVQALGEASFDLQPGEVHALVGENGAGKSTLVGLASGALSPDAGTVEIAGRSLEGADPVRARALGVAPIYQQPALFPDLTVAENLAVGVEPGGAWRRVDWSGRRARARALLERVGASVSPDAPAGTLRMAEQQLVEIARALGAQARVLLMDEPTASLSVREAERLFALVRELRGQGVGIVYVSHRLEEIEALADRVTVLRDGRHVETRPMAGTTRVELIRLMVGREVQAAFPASSAPPGEVRLEVRGFTCRASGVWDVSFELRAREILGLGGLMGSGRTELARALFGLTPRDGGHVRLDGQEVRLDSPARALARGLAYVPEDRRRYGVVPEMTVAENTTLSALRQVARAGLLDRGRERRLAEGFVERLAIRGGLGAPVATLSGGNQQKVAVARGLATRPRVLILDEPTQGVDVGAKAEIHRLVRELAEEGMAILMISSDLPELLGMSDRIAVMHGGTLVGTLGRAEASPERILALALGPSGPRDAAASAGIAP